MNLEQIHSVYLIGIGGIGMSALARFFLHSGKLVSGYDRSETELTKKLIQEGASIHYISNVDLIPNKIKEDK